MRGTGASPCEKSAIYGRSNAQPDGPLLRAAFSHWLRREARRMPGFALLREPLSSKTDGNLSWLSADLRAQVPRMDTDAWALPLSGVLEHSVERRPLPLYLRVEDCNSMAHSVEARLPFLDYRLVVAGVFAARRVEVARRLEQVSRARSVEGRHRGAGADANRQDGVPDAQQGTGGAGDWVRADDGFPRSRALRESGVCDADTVETSLQRHVQGQIDFSGELFRLAEFATWLEVKGPSRNPMRAGTVQTCKRWRTRMPRSRGVISGETSMSKMTLAWVVIYSTLVIASFINPLYGTLGYLFEYYLRPSMHWWGEPLPDLRWNFTIAAVLTFTFLLRRSSLPDIGPARRGPGLCLAGMLFIMLLVTPTTAVNPSLSWNSTTNFSKLILFHGLLVGTVRTRARLRCGRRDAHGRRRLVGLGGLHRIRSAAEGGWRTSDQVIRSATTGPRHRSSRYCLSSPCTCSSARTRS